MATKKGNGHNTVTVEMVEILREIRGEPKGTNTGLDTLQTELHEFKEEVHEDLTALGAKL